MSYKKFDRRGLSKLGRKLTLKLLALRAPYPGLVIDDLTGTAIRSDHNIDVARRYDLFAIGPYYEAFGFIYVLCSTSCRTDTFVKIFWKSSDQKNILVGRVFDVARGIVLESDEIWKKIGL